MALSPDDPAAVDPPESARGWTVAVSLGVTCRNFTPETA